jgi:hypothetical protein
VAPPQAPSPARAPTDWWTPHHRAAPWWGSTHTRPHISTTVSGPTYSTASSRCGDHGGPKHTNGGLLLSARWPLLTTSGGDSRFAHGNGSAVEGSMGPLIVFLLLQGGGGGATVVPFRRCVHQICGGGETPILGLGLIFQFFFDLDPVLTRLRTLALVVLSLGFYVRLWSLPVFRPRIQLISSFI